MPFNPIGRFVSTGGFARKADFKRPVTFFDRVRFVGSDSTMEIFGGVLSGDISADVITLGTLDAARIAAGSLDADKITAGTITADRLILGSFDNLIQNPGAETGSLTPHDASDDGGATGWTAGSTPRSGAFAFNFDSTNQSSDADLKLNGTNSIGNHPSAAEGDKFYFEAWGEYSGDGPGNDLVVVTHFRDEGDILLGTATSAVLTPTTSPQLMTVVGTAPAGTAYVVFSLRVLNDGNTPTLGHNFDDCYARRQIGSVVIEDGAITADKITVTSLDAITATMGSLNVDKILTMSSTGKIRTAVSGQRMEIANADLNRISFFSGDSNEEEEAYIEYEPGTFSTYWQGGYRTGLGLSAGEYPSISMNGQNGTVTLQGKVIHFLIHSDGQVFINKDGSASTPAFSINSPSTGLYKSGTDEIAFSAGGAQRMRIDTTTVRAGTGIDISVQGSSGAEYISRNNPRTNGTLTAAWFSVSGVFKLMRTSSTRKHKKYITDAPYLADVTLRPRRFQRKGTDYFQYGFIVEELMEEDELLGIWDGEDFTDFSDRSVMAIMAAKINRLEARLDKLEKV